MEKEAGGDEGVQTLSKINVESAEQLAADPCSECMQSIRKSRRNFEKRQHEVKIERDMNRGWEGLSGKKSKRKNFDQETLHKAKETHT